MPLEFNFSYANKKTEDTMCPLPTAILGSIEVLGNIEILVREGKIRGQNKFGTHTQIFLRFNFVKICIK